MTDTNSNETRPRPIAILVNGPSSSGKTTLCKALQESLAHLADGDPDAAFARVAFDDVVVLIAEALYPISFVTLQGADVSNLVSRKPHDGRAGWEYVDESEWGDAHPGSPGLRLEFNPHGRRLLTGLHKSWGVHLELGTNLIIDHFLQDEAWCREMLDTLRESNARVFTVGVFCSLAELERRESARGDGGIQGRPLGLARRSKELCHSHGLTYDVEVNSDREPTAASIERIVAALCETGMVATGVNRG